MSKNYKKKIALKGNKNIDSIKYYNAISEGYEELHRTEQINKLLIARELLKLKKEDSLLDVGSGIGLSSEVFDCKITLLDNSINLLKLAKKRIKNKNNINLVLSNAEKMPFKNKEFDAVICITAIHNFSNPDKALGEILRVTKDIEKNIVISILKKSSKNNELVKMIKKFFKIEKVVDEGKDLIFLLSKK
ncbi:MAG: methyltransferase domain-containing protein [Candidatus Woesearchaeota archaeon]